MALLAILAACSGPVWSGDCTVLRSARGPVLRATLQNLTSKPVANVGVLVDYASLFGGGGDPVEYAFPVRLAPFGHAANALSTQYTVIFPGENRGVRYGTAASCWAREVYYADGSAWSVTPI